jgi:hypothetical protein
MKVGHDPIFIGGLSHTGKTELRQVLGAHPELSMTRRTSLWDLYYLRFGDLGRIDNLDRCLSSMFEERGVKQLQIDRAEIRREFLDGPSNYARLFGLLHLHHARAAGKRRWGDQLGSVERFADPIFETFPSARMIHMIRDPRARFSEASARPRRRRRGSLGSETAAWLRSVELADRNRYRYSGNYLIVHYEDLATSTTTTIERVCEFLGEAFTSNMKRTAESIAFASPESPRATDRAVVRRQEGVSPQDAFMNRYAGESLRALGYPVTSVGISPAGSLPFLLVDWPLNRATMAWRLTAGRVSDHRVRSSG